MHLLSGHCAVRRRERVRWHAVQVRDAEVRKEQSLAAGPSFTGWMGLGRKNEREGGRWVTEGESL